MNGVVPLAVERVGHEVHARQLRVRDAPSFRTRPWPRPSHATFEAFLERTKEPGRAPYYAGTFWYGRPLKPHGWQPWTNRVLLRLMQRQVEANGPR